LGTGRCRESGSEARLPCLTPSAAEHFRLLAHRRNQATSALAPLPGVSGHAPPSAANPKFARFLGKRRCELQAQTGTRIIDLRVSFRFRSSLCEAASAGELRNPDTSR